jgi:hypothetical protein
MGLARLAALLMLIASLAGAAPAAAQEPGPHQAGLVVVFDDGRVVTRCVSFSEETITGAELIRRSGLSVVLGSYGGLGYGVCAIEDVGCQVGRDCFCQCRGTPCAYWTYSHRRSDGQWAISGVGASSWELHDGDVDGWVWGDGSSAPPTLSLTEICPGVDTADPRQGAGPTSAPLPSPVLNPSPTPERAGSAPADPSPILSNGYPLFGLVVVGLLAWLSFTLLRRK